MKRLLTATVVPLAVMLAAPVFAGPREDLLAKYAAAAKSSGFSAARGQTLHTRNFAGGKPDTPACISCHGKDPRGAGRTTTGKSIEAVAVSATPTRYTDPAKVEKWFKRNCNDVLGRECTPQEKGDWLTYVLGQ
jgi:mono/diheme cytochrome c family protein